MTPYWTRLVAGGLMCVMAGCTTVRDTATVEGCAPDAEPANPNFTLEDMNGNDSATTRAR